jgi:hypothetical protein
MGSGSKKKKGEIDMGNYSGNVKERLAYEWCMHNGIYISPFARTPIEWYICIVINGKSNISPESYKKDDIWKNLYKFYVYYYDKYNNIPKKVEEVTNKKVPTKRTQKVISTDNLKLF